MFFAPKVDSVAKESAAELKEKIQREESYNKKIKISIYKINNDEDVSTENIDEILEEILALLQKVDEESVAKLKIELNKELFKIDNHWQAVRKFLPMGDESLSSIDDTDKESIHESNLENHELISNLTRGCFGSLHHLIEMSKEKKATQEKEKEIEIASKIDRNMPTWKDMEPVEPSVHEFTVKKIIALKAYAIIDSISNNRLKSLKEQYKIATEAESSIFNRTDFNYLG